MNKVRIFYASLACLICLGLWSCSSMDQGYDPRFNPGVAASQSNGTGTQLPGGNLAGRTERPSQPLPVDSQLAVRKATGSKKQEIPEEVAGNALVNERPKLSPGDVVELKVYQEDELSARARVDNDGMATFPLLKPLVVKGKTLEEARVMIKDILAKEYLTDPHVSLTVVEFAKRRFSVMGEVKAPGFYSIPEDTNLNLLQALSMAGGYTAFSKGTRVRIKRIIDGRESVMRVDAQAMANEKNVKVITIQPDDAIEVGSSIF
ncbi:polysaccharide biosynthesis/export family protein [Pedosphaera parvula]|uniref:Polysaccharide export protein n=1 Tax=Pedosphaera parvula (strain Ellin514) TaxID=320771 RepID=B9XAX0_PEDPL|nr:polysaccharide biosynthesis/export family protein [Pedosphaera parvula]EEF63155.1 polysaccharide export protein [Pedosphaera parvula Ellin514]